MRVNKVSRTEHHALDTCPCPDCKRVRRDERRKGRKSSTKQFSPEDAFTLGYVNTRSPAGSLARQLGCEVKAT